MRVCELQPEPSDHFSVSFFFEMFVLFVRFFHCSKPVLYVTDRLRPTNMTLFLCLCVLGHLGCLPLTGEDPSDW